MVKAYQIIVVMHANEHEFSQWFVEMDAKQVSEMRALLKSGVEKRAYTRFVLRLHRPESYRKTFKALSDLIENWGCLLLRDE